MKKPKPKKIPEKNALEQFRDYWSKLNITDQWNMWWLLTVLRGPDNDRGLEEAIKYETTEIIRGAVFEGTVFGDNDRHVSKKHIIPLTFDETSALAKSDHFASHIQDALRSLESFGYDYSFKQPEGTGITTIDEKLSVKQRFKRLFRRKTP